MAEIDLTAGSMHFQSYSGMITFGLTVKYNDAVSVRVQLRGEDELYALQYLVDRAIKKLESNTPDLAR